MYENIKLKVDGNVQMNSTYTVAVFIYKHTTHRVFMSLFRPEKDTARYRDSDVPLNGYSALCVCVCE